MIFPVKTTVEQPQKTWHSRVHCAPGAVLGAGLGGRGPAAPTFEFSWGAKRRWGISSDISRIGIGNDWDWE